MQSDAEQKRIYLCGTWSNSAGQQWWWQNKVKLKLSEFPSSITDEVSHINLQHPPHLLVTILGVQKILKWIDVVLQLHNVTQRIFMQWGKKGGRTIRNIKINLLLKHLFIYCQLDNTCTSSGTFNVLSKYRLWSHKDHSSLYNVSRSGISNLNPKELLFWTVCYKLDGNVKRSFKHLFQL